MFKFNPPKVRILIGLTCLSIVSICALTTARSLRGITSGDNGEDPILALPTLEQSYEVPNPTQLSQTVGNESPRYVGQSGYTLQYRQPPAESAGQEEQPTPGAKQEVYYMMQPQTPPEPAENTETHGPHCTHKHEYVTEASPSTETDGENLSKREYPSEIIYVSQNGDPIRTAREQQESDPRIESNVASMISGSSNLPATILTEVPARDMPLDVLERLKKDYGVKVVATRSYPGANLIINCEDESTQGIAICAKSSALMGTMNHAPYTYSTPASETASEQPEPNSNEQPSYTPDESSGERSAADERFGSRTGNRGEESDSNSEHESSMTTEDQPAQQGERTEAHSDSESGFEVQPNASEKVERSQSGKRQHHVRRQ